MFNIDLLLLNIFNFLYQWLFITPFPFLKLDMDYNFLIQNLYMKSINISILVLISNVGNFLGILDICSVRGLI